MTFKDFIQELKTVLLDGAMGTQLARLGLEMGGIKVHKSYSRIGCNA